MKIEDLKNYPEAFRKRIWNAWWHRDDKCRNTLIIPIENMGFAVQAPLSLNRSGLRLELFKDGENAILIIFHNHPKDDYETLEKGIDFFDEYVKEIYEKGNQSWLDVQCIFPDDGFFN